MTRKAIDRARRDLVTPEMFVARHGPDWKRRGIRPPVCPACGEPLHLYGIHSVKAPAAFHHPDGSQCPLSRSPDPRYAHLVPSDWDLAAGHRLKERFCEKQNLKEGYAACHALCFGHLSATEFLELCRRADRKNVWSYKGITLEVLPYILVTLMDFPVNETVNRSYPLRLVLQKQPREPIDALWLHPGECRLIPHFADEKGKRMTRLPERRIPDPEIERRRTDTGWISDALLRKLRQCCVDRERQSRDAVTHPQHPRL